MALPVIKMSAIIAGSQDHRDTHLAAGLTEVHK
jgi:hypothetical protein